MSVVRSSAGIIVRKDDGVKSFTQGEVDKRGVKIVRDGQPVQLREGDKRVRDHYVDAAEGMTDQEVNATFATARPSGGPAAPAPGRSSDSRAPCRSRSVSG